VLHAATEEPASDLFNLGPSRRVVLALGLGQYLQMLYAAISKINSGENCLERLSILRLHFQCGNWYYLHLPGERFEERKS